MSRILIIIITLMIFAPVAVHADEFGDRFYNRAPAGLGDYTAEPTEIPDIAMDDAAQDLQDIMPAAGEEQPQQDDTAQNTPESE